MKNTIDQQERYEITAVDKGLYVPFHVIFDRRNDENLKLFNFLPLNRRIQLNQLDLITEDYNIIMNVLFQGFFHYIVNRRYSGGSLFYEENPCGNPCCTDIYTRYDCFGIRYRIYSYGR